MKCEKCGKEANFFYSSTVNGQHEEHCFCADCAREAGFENAFRFEPMEDMFGGFFEDFFAPVRFPSLFDSFGGAFRSMLSAPVFPRLTLAPARTEQPQAAPQSQAEAAVPADAGAEMKTRRETEALREQLRQAVEAEDFEKAIVLRDQLKKLEG